MGLDGATVSKGYIQIRRGLEEHLDAGRLSLFEAGVYVLIHLQANYETGVWIGSAPKILATAPRGTNLRDVQRAIERLREIGFLRVFHTHGQRGNYRALINRYEPQFGALKGMRLNADKSTSWQSPVYESCAEDALKTRSSRAESDAEDAPIPKEEEKENKKTPAAKPAPPFDPRHKPFVDFAFEAFRKKFLQPPTWGPKHYKGLSLFLARHKQVTQAEWERRYLNFLASTDRFYQQEHGSLVIFVGHFDSFIDGPVLERKSNGKSISDAYETTLSSHASAERLTH